MSDDDLFSRLFELFNQPGPVNWKMAAEVAHHLTGERVPVEPWAAEEYRELARLSEYRIEPHSPVSVPSASDVLPVDAREWADRHLEAFGYLSEGFGADVSGGPLAQMAPALAGMQIGSLVGGLATWVMASFDGGLPADRDLPVAIVVPHVEEFAERHEFDTSTVRLWVVTEEVAFRTLGSVPFTVDHLRNLLAAEAATVDFDPSMLTGLIGAQSDPSRIQAELTDRISEAFGSEETQRARRQTTAYLGLLGGYARLISERTTAELLPDQSAMVAARDQERAEAQPESPIPLGAGPPPIESIQTGREFCLEVERRYGPDELTRLWTAPQRIPTAEEIEDPVAWAARVLLEDF